MPIVAVAWIYVAGMAALAEALSPQGTVLGAVFTFLLYGALPLGVVLYMMATPARKSALRRAEAAELAALRQAAAQPAPPPAHPPANPPTHPPMAQPARQPVDAPASGPRGTSEP